MVHTHRSLDNALKMPAFTLNVRNQISNRLLLTVIGIQLLTNILLILMVWMKIGTMLGNNDLQITLTSSQETISLVLKLPIMMAIGPMNQKQFL